MSGMGPPSMRTYGMNLVAPQEMNIFGQALTEGVFCVSAYCNGGCTLDSECAYRCHQRLDVNRGVSHRDAQARRNRRWVGRLHDPYRDMPGKGSVLPRSEADLDRLIGFTARGAGQGPGKVAGGGL